MERVRERASIFRIQAMVSAGIEFIEKGRQACVGEQTPGDKVNLCLPSGKRAYLAQIN